MYCPSCGKAITAGSAFCMHCGRATGLVAGASNAQGGSTSLSGTPVCPNCGQMDSATKVSGLVARETVAYRSTALAEMLREKLQLPSPESFLNATRRKLGPSPPYGKDGEQLIQWQAEVRMRASNEYLEYYRLFDKLYYCGRCNIAFVGTQQGFVSLGDVTKDLDIGARVEPDANVLWGYDICEIEACAGAKINFTGWVSNTGVRFIAVGANSRGYYIVAKAEQKDGCTPCINSSQSPIGVVERFSWQSSPTCENCNQKLTQMVASLIR